MTEESVENEEELVQTTINIPRWLNKLLDDVAKKRGESKSDFWRLSVLTRLARLSYLPEDKKKALGINNSNGEQK